MTETLRWLMIASHVAPQGSGGMARVAVELSRHLEAHDRIELHVVVRPEAASIFTDDLRVAPSRVHAVPFRGAMAQSAREVTGLQMGVAPSRFDVVHGTKHLIPLRGTGSAHTVLTVHDMISLDRPQDFPAAKRALLRRPYEWSLQRAQTLVTVSEATRDRIVAHDPALAAKAVAVPLAVSQNLLDAPVVPIPRLEGRPCALIVGDMSPRKNVRFVARIWRQVAERVDGALLCIVGPEGWGVDDGRDEVAALEADGLALHLGHVSEGELRWAYEHARVTLCPSLLEGFGLPAAEARAFGCPVITSEDPALREASGSTATAVPLDDPSRWVDTTATALGRARSEGRRADGRSWADVADELVDVVAVRAGRGSS